MDLKEKIRNMISKFELLKKEEVELIVEKTIVDSFEKGTILLKEGQIPKKCYMVIEGCVREYILIDGEEKSTAFFTEGDTFTPNSKDSKPSNYYWECSEACVLTISNEDFAEELRLLLPQLNDVFQQIAISKINKAREDLSKFRISSPEERYRNLLVSKSYLLDRIPHHQIASYLGMKPQSLSRIRKRISNEK